MKYVNKAYAFGFLLAEIRMHWAFHWPNIHKYWAFYYHWAFNWPKYANTGRNTLADVWTVNLWVHGTYLD